MIRRYLLRFYHQKSLVLGRKSGEYYQLQIQVNQFYIDWIQIIQQISKCGTQQFEVLLNS